MQHPTGPSGPPRKDDFQPPHHLRPAGVQRLRRLDQSHAAPTETSFPTLRQGATGAAVTTLQYALRAKGYSITIDGIFGSGTATVVKTYQRTAGLTVDGIVGPATWGKVLPVLRSGATGYAVRGLQVELRAHGHSVTVDGQFGPATQAAVIAYQKANRLTADGIVGLQTWGSLVD